MKNKLHLPLIPEGKSLKNIQKRILNAAKKDPAKKGQLKIEGLNLSKGKRREARKAATKSIRRNR